MHVSTRPPARTQPPRTLGATGLPTALATVCIAGTLEEKLSAAAAAGFDG